MLIWANDKPTVPGWYWHRVDSVDLDSVIVRVEPQSNTVGPLERREHEHLEPSRRGMGVAAAAADID